MLAHLVLSVLLGPTSDIFTGSLSRSLYIMFLL
jgi:hypothetical protein